MPDKTGGKQVASGRFQKGESGNPKGRPKGSRNRATLAVEELLEGEAEALTRKAVEMALSGDTTALRLCLERLAPPARERPLFVDLPSIEGPQDLPKALAALLALIGQGEITTSEAERVARIFGTYAQAVETENFELRLQALEEGPRASALKVY
jgi:hypothetical protein